MCAPGVCCAIRLRACYAMSVYQPCACYELSGTDLGHRCAGLYARLRNDIAYLRPMDPRP
eukprot:2306280-Rhodomonas_salina.1